MKIDTGDVWAVGRYRKAVEDRSLLCYWAIRELKLPMASLSSRLNISIPAVSKSVKRGEKLAKTKECLLVKN